MAVLEIESKNLFEIIRGLSKFIDFKRDLPENIFSNGDFVFWFFERPLFSFLNLFSGLIFQNSLCFGSKVIIKFSGDCFFVNSCIALDGENIEKDVLWLEKKFSDFFGGSVGYPVVFFNESFDWFGYESAYEEFGVIAVFKSKLKEDFSKYLDSNFMSSSDISDMSSGCSVEGMIAAAFRKSYLIAPAAPSNRPDNETGNPEGAPSKCLDKEVGGSEG